MNIQYGQKIVKTTYYDGKPSTIEELSLRDIVSSDAEELAMFIKLQQEHKGSKRLNFERQVSDKGTRYVVRTWVD